MKEIIKNLGPGTQLMLLMMIAFLAIFLMQITAFLVIRPIWQVNIFTDMEEIAKLQDEASIQITKTLHFFINVGTFLVPALLFRQFFGDPEKSFFVLEKKQKTTVWLSAILFFVVAIPAINFLHLLNLQLPITQNMAADDAKVTELYTKILGGDGWEILSINLLVYAIVPAIGEELLFRGVILRQIALTTNKIHLSVWITAIAFSIMHADPTLFLPRILMGAALGYLFIWTGNIFISMAAHLINNILTITMINAILNDRLDKRFDSLGMYKEDIIYLSLSIILVAFSLWWMYRNRNTAFPDFVDAHYKEREEKSKAEQDFEE